MNERLFDCAIRERLHDGPGPVVYRGLFGTEAAPVVIKVLSEDASAPGGLAALRHEHAILSDLKGEGVPRTYGLVRDQGDWGLILEDIGGQSLAELRGAGPLALDEILELGICITRILETIHRQRVMHKDVNPSNLVWNRETGRLILIDFGIATMLPRETTAFISPRGLEGTLAYISPEQTGRMNRAMDFRTDYYSLGVTLFELATGQVPFATRDPLELVHCHIAQPPPSMCDIDASIPEPVARIVRKLMAKNADERYQSAQGIRDDLSRCLDSWRRHGHVEMFALGEQDSPEQLCLPQKLYGREVEVERIMMALGRASAGEGMLLMVSGPPGVGKSALIREVYRPLTMQRGYFIEGKFDQYQNHTPFAAIIQALEGLVAQLLTESQDQIASWRDQLRDALHGDLSLLLDMCPGLGLIVDESPEHDTLPPLEARDRLHHAMRTLLAVFATQERSLCLFLDDLQWADADTLALLRALVREADSLPLLVIGAYREVDEDHSLALMLREIAAQGGQVEHLALAELGEADVTAMVADSLAMPVAEVSPLAELLRARTAGNPFFLRSFLTALHEDKLLVRTSRGWRWDLAAIRNRGITDNVVDLMVDRIQRLPSTTRTALVAAACIGNELELGMVATVQGFPEEIVARHLWPAVTEELILVLDPVHSAVEMVEAGPDVRLRFVHDRIQQAVLATVQSEALPALHLDVGRRLLAELEQGGREQRLFEIASHLNQGLPAMHDPAEREELAWLNGRAARKALRAAAAEPALVYARAGLALLGDGYWDTHYERTRDLYIEAVNAAFLGGEIELLDELTQVVLQRASSLMDRVTVWKLLGQARYAQQRLQEAIDIYKQALGQMGFGLPVQVTEDERAREIGVTAEALREHAIERLADLPACTDPMALVAMDILCNMVLMTYTTNDELFPVVICRLVQLSLRHGNSPHSTFGYLFLGVLRVYEHDIESAYLLGRAAVRLADGCDKNIRSQTYHYAGPQLMHWKEPLYEISPSLLGAHHDGLDAGNRFHAAGSAASLCICRFLAGDELPVLRADMSSYGERIRQLRQPLVLTWHQIYEQAVINLQSGESSPTMLAGPVFDEGSRVPQFRKAGDQSSLFNYYYCKSLLCYLFNDFASAAACMESSAEVRAIVGTAFFAGPLAMLDSLCRLAVYEQAGEAAQAQILAAVADNQARLARWLPHCPVNFEHRLRLVEAELARVLGDPDKAAETFAAAVSLAQSSGYMHEAAMACEIAARFHLGNGQPERARDLLRDAHRGYLRWGALAKVSALEKQYPHLLPRVATSAADTLTLSTIGAHDWEGDVLDLIGVLNASQAISREVARDRLLIRLMELVIELAGAECGALLLERDGAWVVEVEKQRDGTVRLLEAVPMEALAGAGDRGLPLSVIRYAARTRTSVVLDNATGSAQFGRDPYIAGHQVKSLLCLPLARQGGQAGILYLENNLITGAFTPARMHVLQLLSTQAIISLDNASLYNTLEQKVIERTQELAEKNQELTSTLATLRDTQARLVMQQRLASLGALSAGIAHEMRNPLNFVNNFARLSQKYVSAISAEVDVAAGSLVREQVQRLEQNVRNLELNLAKIEQHGKRIDGIIRSMLDHSRDGTGERARSNVNALIAEYAKLALQGLRARASSLDITLETELDASLPEVAVVPQEIGRVIINLIDNACYALAKKHQTLGGAFTPRIRVRTREVDGSVEIRVHDNGTGIPTAARDRILDPFFTTKEAGEGTGLGLSISHQVITQGYGGTLTFESEEGEFTEFIVIIPRA